MAIDQCEILVTGGSGMVGSELKKILPNAQYPSSKSLNLLSQQSVINYFLENKVSYVVHLAAHVGSLHDNIENKIEYYDNNILMNTLITKYAYDSGVKNFLGILSTCIYPDVVDSYPIKESELHNGAPHHDLMSYAYAKRAHAIQIDAYRSTHSINYNYIIPSNLFGIVSEAHKERSHFVNDLIYKVLDAKNKGRDYIELFGDGSPLRQFMLASDFAKFIKEYVASEKIYQPLNVAPDNNLSIDEMARMALVEAGVPELEVRYNASKPNGQFRKDVCTKRLKENFPDFKFSPFEKALAEIIKYYE